MEWLTRWIWLLMTYMFRGRAIFFIFLVLQWFYNAKRVFLAFNASLLYVGLIMFAAFSYSRFPCFELVSRVWDVSPDISPCFPLARRLCKLCANTGRKLQIQRQPFLVQYKQQANLLLSMHNYTPLVISGNDKNEQLTLLSQRNLEFSGRNILMAL